MTLPLWASIGKKNLKKMEGVRRRSHFYRHIKMDEAQMALRVWIRWKEQEEDHVFWIISEIHQNGWIKLYNLIYLNLIYS